jgi:tetratricopeptide (TPR) repeat protein
MTRSPLLLAAMLAAIVAAGGLPIASAEVDERPLWRLHDDGRLDELQRLLTDFARWYPDWRPPIELLARVALHGVQPQPFIWEQIRSAGGAMPERFGCAEVHHAWALELAYRNIAARDEAVALARRVIVDCSPADRLTTLQRAHAAYPFTVTHGLLQDLEARHPDAFGDAALADFRLGFHRAWLGDALSRNRVQQATPAAHWLSSELRARAAPERATPGAADGARLLGWWSLALERPGEAAEWFGEALAADPSGDAAHGLVLAWRAHGRGEEADLLARQWQHREPALARLLAAQPDARVQAPITVAPPPPSEEPVLQAMFAAQEDAVARDAGESIAPWIVAQRRGDAALKLGWSHHRMHDHRRALEWFQRAHEWSPDADTAYAIAAASHALADGPTVAAMAERWGAESAALRTLYGWNLYGQRRFAAALDQFTLAYRQAPTTESAEGLSLAALASARRDVPPALAREIAGPIEAIWPSALARWSLDRGHFRLAAAQSPGLFPELENLDSPTVSARPYARSRSGTSARGRLATRGVQLRVDGGSGPHMAQVQVDFFGARSGRAPSDPGAAASIGTPGLPWIVAPTTSARLAEAQFGYVYEAALSPRLAIGLGPAGGEIAPVVTGQLALDWSGNRHDASIALFSAPRRDSILAMSGIRDPATGRAFGRVHERGAQARWRHQTGSRWSIDVAGAAAQLDGRGVARNRRQEAQVHVAYAWNTPRYRYLAIGPAWRHQRYDHDRSGFTAGHGGYFSPQQFRQAGMQVAVLTPEGRAHNFAGHLFAGYEWSETEATLALPLANGGPLLPGSRRSGASISGGFSAARRLTPHWQVGAYVSGSRSLDFDELEAGVRLRWSHLPRAAVLSTDLPRP